MRVIIIFTFSIFLLLGNLPVIAQKTNPNNQDEELGKVAWYRDYDTAVQLSKKENKPILILFQQVPGCSTCKNYGHQVLSHPLMTEAIQHEFIPLAIFNNKKGADEKILKKYKEPSWNNPVVRIVDYKGKNMADRLSEDYSASALYKSMKEALRIYGTPIPTYMTLLEQEVLAINNEIELDEAYFKMYCFWSGEKELGSQKGILATKAGFMNNNEVVRVIYNKNEVSKETLANFAEKRKMTAIAKTQFQWSENDEDYYLQNSRYKYLPLTEIQKTKINSALGKNTSAKQYLSPQQLIWFKEITKGNSPVLFNKDFKEAWEQLALKSPAP